MQNTSSAYNPSEPPPLSKWNSDQQHYDATESFGLTLPRTINSTRWADERHISNRSPFDVRLWEIMPFGADNYIFRSMAAGRWVGVEYVRNARESQLVGTFLKQLRESRMNLDTTIEQVCTDNNLNASTTEGRTEAFKHIAIKLSNAVHGMTYKAPHDSGMAQQLSQQTQLNAEQATKIKELEQLLAQKPPTLPTTGSGTPSSPVTKSPLSKYFAPQGASEQDKPPPTPPIDDKSSNLGQLLQALSNHPAKQLEILGSTAPTSPNDVDTWIASLKMAPDKKRHLQSLLQQYDSLTAKAHAPSLTESKDLLVRYGLPMAKATSYKLKPAVRALITATFLIE